MRRVEADLAAMKLKLHDEIMDNAIKFHQESIAFLKTADPKTAKNYIN